MKGVQGIVIAVALGIVGAVCNWFYISKQARDFKKVSFVAIDSSAQINLGDKFLDKHFERVDIPLRTVGNLEKVAVLWEDRGTVVGMAATKSYVGGEILLGQDLKTPAQGDLGRLLGEDEVAYPVPVDPRVFVPDNFNPGDRVEFFLPQYIKSRPARVSVSSEFSRKNTENIVGPFRILALGNRKGTRQVREAFRQRSKQEHVITVSLTFRNRSFDEKANHLFRLLTQAGGRGLQVITHSVKNKGTQGP